MKERLTWEFTRDRQGAYAVSRFRMECDAGGASQWCGAAWAESVKDGEVAFGERSSVNVLALAFVRVAQLRYVGIRTSATKEACILPVTSAAAFTKFKGLYESTTKPSGRTGWVKYMLFLPGDRDHRGRLQQWFSVSKKASGGGVRCDLTALWPEHISILIEGKPADEADINRLEAFLAYGCNAGFPCHFEEGRMCFGGRMISVRPEWLGQEEACAEADRITACRDVAVLSVIGGAASGKTVFAVRWLRRMLAENPRNFRFVFQWPFNRGPANFETKMPIWEFFAELASMLGAPLSEGTTPVEQVSLILEVLRSKPTLFLLDGLEAVATLRDRRKENREPAGALAMLVEDIARGSGSFLVSTSRVGLSQLFDLPADHVRELRIEPVRVEPLITDLLPFEHVTENRAVSIAALCRLLRQATLQDNASKNETPEVRTVVDRILDLLDECPRVLLCIVAASISAIEEADMLAVAWELAERNLLEHGVVSGEAWEEALTFLCEETPLLHAAMRQGSYSMYKAYGDYIAESLQRNALGHWIAINDVLGAMKLSRCPPEIHDNTHVPVLMEAAIYFCRAGKKHVAYGKIGRQILNKGLKGYILNHLCDYETPRIVNAAILAHDPAFPNLALSLEALALTRHVDALCARFSDNLSQALIEEREAWQYALRAGTSSAILPAGIGMVRLCHIFGLLHEAKQIESVVFKRMVADIGDKMTDKFLRRKSDYLDPSDMADGIGIIFSTLALSKLYRGEYQWTVDLTLSLALKSCRDHKSASILLPTFGRPWHALALLETGRWKECEQAMEAGEWIGHSHRYRRNRCFELLAGKLFLAKAKDRTTSSADRPPLLTEALCRVREATSQTEGRFRWWHTLGLICEGEILCEAGQFGESDKALNRALAQSRTQGFQLLEVDALAARAWLAHALGNEEESRNLAGAGLEISERVGYGLRKKRLRSFSSAQASVL